MKNLATVMAVMVLIIAMGLMVGCGCGTTNNKTTDDMVDQVPETTSTVPQTVIPDTSIPDVIEGTETVPQDGTHPTVDENGNLIDEHGNIVDENGNILEDAGDAVGNVIDDAGNTVGDVMEDVGEGIKDMTTPSSTEDKTDTGKTNNTSQ